MGYPLGQRLVGYVSLLFCIHLWVYSNALSTDLHPTGDGAISRRNELPEEVQTQDGTLMSRIHMLKEVQTPGITSNERTRKKRATPKGCPTSCAWCDLYGTELTIKNCTSDLEDDLPDLFRLLPNLTTLSISETHLSKVPCEVSTLIHLTKLTLPKNRIQVMPWHCLRTMPLLAEVDLHRNNITVLRNGSFYDFPSLRTLYLDQNQISVIELDVFVQSHRLSFLRKIYLNDNKLSSLDSWPISLVKDGKSGILLSFDDNYI